MNVSMVGALIRFSGNVTSEKYIIKYVAVVIAD
jgi:hypothetical protein